MFNLPTEIKSLIYEYDSTYKHNYDNVMNELDSPTKKLVRKSLQSFSEIYYNIVETKDNTFVVYYKDKIEIFELKTYNDLLEIMEDENEFYDETEDEDGDQFLDFFADYKMMGIPKLDRWLFMTSVRENFL